MAKDPEWGRWLRSARRAYEERNDGSLTYKEIGQRLGERLRRPAFRHTTVRAWFVNGQEPESIGVMRALISVLEAEAGYVIVPQKEADYELNPSDATLETAEARARNQKIAAAQRAVRKRKRAGKKLAKKAVEKSARKVGVA